MKTLTLALMLSVVMALPCGAALPVKDRLALRMSADLDNQKYINANNILMFVTNHGSLGFDVDNTLGYWGGTFFPYNTVAEIENGSMTNRCLYASGLWIGGRVAGETRVAVAEYADEYTPGPMVGGTNLPDDPSFRVYKLYSDSLAGNPNADYLNWPVDQGAPVDAGGNPEMIGDQMLWAVFNDGDPSQHTSDAGSTAPLGVEIRQTVFAFDASGALGNTIFMRYRIYNMSSSTIDGCYFSLWADPDLGGAADDVVGCDTTLDMAYVYNATNADDQYGATPPALGFRVLQGPLQYTGSSRDTATMFGEDYVGYADQGMTAFAKHINGTDPNSAADTYNYMQGLLPLGIPYIWNGNQLRYHHSGDPVSSQGDLDYVPIDCRFLITTGPITFAAGDSTEIIIALVVGQRANRLESVVALREDSEQARLAYEAGFQPAAAELVFVDHLSDPMDMGASGTVRVTAVGGPDSVILNYRQGGRRPYSRRSMQALADDVYTGTVSSSASGMSGVEYYVAAYYDRDSLTQPPAGDQPTAWPYHVQTQFSDISGPALPDGVYQMVGFPFEADPDGVSAIFEDDLGAPDPTRWRLGRWNPGIGDYDEYHNVGRIQQGRGYWLVVRGDQQRIDVSGRSTFPDVLIEDEAYFTVALQPGWNQVSNPYAFDVPWGECRVANDVEPFLHRYTGSGYQQVSTLEPFTGYWVKNNAAVDAEMYVFFGDVESVGAGSGSRPQIVDQWRIELQLSTPTVDDLANRCGVSSQARDGRDEFDFSEPPVFDRYVSLAFVDRSTNGGTRLLGGDFRAPSDTGWQFDLLVRGNTGEPIRLTLGDSTHLPDDMELKLVDENGNWLCDLGRKGSVNLPEIPGDSGVLYRLLVGRRDSGRSSSDDAGERPSSVVLFQNRPNPFNPVTEISFFLPEASMVSLDIFNLTGQRVAKLSDEFRDAGTHTISWNAGGLASGVYFYRLEAGERVCTRKMVLLK